jgi:murein DD-endopeptidase MepM/ murein hydrolase activator NlpD
MAVAETAAQLSQRLAVLKARSEKAGRAFSRAYWELDETEVALGRTRTQMRITSKRLKAAKAQLNDRATAIYRRPDFDALGFLVGSASFQEFINRSEFLARLGAADARAVATVKHEQNELLKQKRRLTAQQKQRAKDVARLRKQRDALQSRLAATEREYRSVKRRLDAMRSGGSLPAGVFSAAGPNGMVFPVAGANYYANTWGASRSGGRRRHQGTDIMARAGTPCVAVLSGSVTAKMNRLGGRTIWLRANNGWTFYYAHLQSWTVRSGRVRAGQVIGTVGSTGNASGGAPHLHFEIHPGGGGAVNPYPYLRSME